MDAMDSSKILSSCSNKFSQVSAKRDMFLTDPGTMLSVMLECTKQVSEFQDSWKTPLESSDDQSLAKPGAGLSSLATLRLEKFDLEQVWQVIKLNNDFLLTSNHSKARENKRNRILGLRRKRQDDVPPSPHHVAQNFERPKSETANENPNMGLLEETESEEIDDEEMIGNENLEAYEKRQKMAQKKGRQSVLDDGFFNLDEMNKFLDEEDKKEQKKLQLEDESDDSIEDDNLDDEGSDGTSDENDKMLDNDGSTTAENLSNARNIKFAEYFDMPDFVNKEKKKIVNFECSDEGSDDGFGDDGSAQSDDDSASDNANDEEEVNKEEDTEQSKFETDTKKMKKVISILEKENLGKKSWQTVGEVSASKRPKNSLLEEHLTFDQHVVGAPTITEETTLTLEDLIKQRIKDEAWDDVTRKVKPVEKPFEYKKRLELDQEKSKIGLAEVYEKEYIKQAEDKSDDEENPAHEEIRTMMNGLFAKLNALSNFCYTPKQPKPELKVVSNLPSLQMEECMPVTTSNHQMLAPEEIHDKTREEAKGETEKTTTDKKRERREKKAKKKQKLKAKEKAAKTSNGSLHSKKAALKKLANTAKISSGEKSIKDSLKSSSKFFDKLQENIQQQLKGDEKPKKNKVRTTNALHIKL
eukprot:gene9479-10469_t